MTAEDLPEYRCIAHVRAAKIRKIEYHSPTTFRLSLTLGHKHASDVLVPVTYMEKHQPKVGGYFVQYPDGDVSYSPAKAFEEGYVLV